MRNKCYLIILSLIVYGCTNISMARKFSTLKYGHSIGGADKKFNITGFYTLCDTIDINTPDSTFLSSAPFYYNLIFYDDGTCAEFYPRFIQDNGDVHSAPLDQVTNIKYLQDGTGRSWGVYKMERDTIIAELYSRTWFWTYGYYWVAYRDTYVVVDSNHLKRISFELPESEKRELNSLLRFVPTRNVLSPHDGFLRKEKWMWNSITEWQEFQSQSQSN